MDWIPIVVTVLSLTQVIDGDTVRAPNGQSIRLTGYNAPELNAKCPKERALAQKAKARLDQLIRTKGTTLVIDKKFCSYGRECGLLMVNNEDVGDIMISEGLAERLICFKGKCPKPRTWCE